MNDTTKQIEIDYMLQEVERTSRLIGERQNRLDRIMSYFLTILSAISLYGIVAAITADSKHTALILGVSTLLLTIVGPLALLSMLGIIAEIVSGLGDYYLRRQYFVDTFPAVAKQYLKPRSRKRIQELWATGFNLFAICLLGTIALFNSVFLYLFLSALSFLITRAQPQDLIEILNFSLTRISVSAIVFIGQLILIWCYIARSRKHIDDILSLPNAATETAKSDSSTGTPNS